MVCSRCKMVVRSEFEKFGLHPVSVELGEVELDTDLSDEEKAGLNAQLLAFGFSFIDDRRTRIIEKVKNLIVDLVQNRDGQLRTNLSDYLSKDFSHDYNYISNLFTQVEGTTIEQYFIAQRIEKVKELLVYDEHSLSQIADDMGYSSVSHLSKQFKKVTGLTPSHFKQLRENKRRPIEDL